MNLKFLKSKDQVYALDYFVYINDKKTKLDNSIIIQNDDKTCEFYVKTFWSKSKLYEFKAEGSYIVSIGNVLTKNILVTFFVSFFLLLFNALYFDNSFTWNLLATVSFLFLIFQLYIYTLGSKYFIKIDIQQQ